MAKNIFLACAPPFVVAEMKPFLERIGCKVIKLEKLDDTLDKSQGSLQRLAKQIAFRLTILGVALETENAGVLGKSDTFLYISKGDLADAARRTIASRMVLRHFR